MSHRLRKDRPAPGATVVWTISYCPPHRAGAYSLKRLNTEAEARALVSSATADPKAFVNSCWAGLVKSEETVLMEHLNVSSGFSQILK